MNDLSSLIFAFVAAASIPSAITGFCFWLLQRKITKRDEKDKAEREARQKQVDKLEAARQKNQLYIIKQLSACTSLAFATARAVQRLPDAHCNGDMDSALAYAQKIKGEARDFLDAQAVDAIY